MDPRDQRGHTIDLAPIRELLNRIVAAWRPEQVWLFGSRARGTAALASDWDVLAVVPDSVEDDAIGPLESWRLVKAAHAHADVVPCRASDFRRDWDTPNTLVNEVARSGILVYER